MSASERADAPADSEAAAPEEAGKGPRTARPLPGTDAAEERVGNGSAPKAVTVDGTIAATEQPADPKPGESLDPDLASGWEPPRDDPAFTEVDEACHGPLVAAWGDLENRLVSGPVAALERAKEAHLDLVREAGLDEDAPERSEDRIERIVAYRRGLASNVVEPMSLSFQQAAPIGSIFDALTRALDEAAQASRELPERADVPWRADALKPCPEDTRRRRIGKRFARVFSRARKTGRERTVPMRAVALRHLDREVAPTLDQLAEESMRAWATWTGTLETSILAFSDASLAPLVKLEHPDAEGADELWTTLGEAGTELDAQLAKLIASAPTSDTTALARERLSRARRVLEANLAVAGSFLYEPQIPAGRPTLLRGDRLEAAADTWDQAVLSRLKLVQALLSIMSGTTGIQRRLISRLRDRALAGAEELPPVADALDNLREAFVASASPVSRRMEELEAKVTDVLEPTLDAVPKHSEVQEVVAASSDATLEAIPSIAKQMPETLSLLLDGAPVPTRNRKVETRVVTLQEMTRQAFDALRVEKMRSSTAALVGSVEQVRADMEELPKVFSFAFEAAEKELEEGEEDAEEKAEALVVEALLSMSESLRGGATTLRSAVEDAQRKLATAVGGGTLALLDRLVAGRMTAHLLAARSWFVDLQKWVNKRWGPTLVRWRRVAGVRAALLRRLATKWLRRGSELVSGTQGSQGASARSIRTLADADSVMADLPLVYQRLFTLDPLTDSTLLSERSAELADAMGRWARWQSSDGIPLIVRGRPGSGVTSFLNSLSSSIEADLDEDGAKRRKEKEKKKRNHKKRDKDQDSEPSNVLRLDLEERVQDEATLAAILADALNLEAPRRLNELAQSIFDAAPENLPEAVIVDSLEHVYLRVPGGTDLIERFLTLMAETEPQILWIGGITSSAWQLVETAEPNAIIQVDVLDLPPLQVSGLRNAIMLRHRRSGLPIRFEEPEVGRHLLRRRLRRLRDPAAYGELLEADFFDRLQRTSSGDVRLALFQWLLATDFDQGDGVLMHPPERPDFGVLESLSLTQNFTLKAFIEHKTLTLAEHDRIFRTVRHESYQIFESLGNRHLIQARAAANGNDPQRSEIQEDLRYEVQPLLVGAVISHLRGRNIIH